MERRIVAFLLIALSLAAGAVAAEQKQGASTPKQIMLTPDELLWRPGPAEIPNSEVAIVEGNPQKAEYFVMRIKLPAGTRIAPHYHEKVERVTVISGGIRLAMGTTQDNPKALPAGSYFAISPKVVHNAWCEGETVLQVSTRGPWSLKSVGPAEKKVDGTKK